MPFSATWVQVQIIILNEVSQKEKEKCHRISLIGNKEVKCDTNEPIYKIETDSQTEASDLRLPRESWGGRGMDWEFGVGRCKLLPFRMDKHQGLAV